MANRNNSRMASTRFNNSRTGVSTNANTIVNRTLNLEVQVTLGSVNPNGGTIGFFNLSPSLGQFAGSDLLALMYEQYRVNRLEVLLDLHYLTVQHLALINCPLFLWQRIRLQ